MDELPNARVYGNLGQTFRGSNVARGHQADCEPLGGDGSAEASETSPEYTMGTSSNNAIPSHGGVLSLTKQDMEFLRSSVLEMSTSVAACSKQPGDTAPKQPVEPSPVSLHQYRESPSVSSSEDIPEEIQDQTICQPNSVHSMLDVDTAVRRRISRPLSSKHASSPAATSPRIPGSRKPALLTSAPASAAARGIDLSMTDHAQATGSQPQHTVAAVMQRYCGSRTAAHTIAGLGEGEGIMHQLSKQAQSMDGKSAAVLNNILDTLSQARHEGVDLTALFEGLIADATSPAVKSASVAATPQGLTDCTRSTKTAAMRLPRGLLPDALTKANPHDHKNEVILRLLGSHDDSSCVVRLKCIEVLDQASQRIEISQHDVTVHGCPGAEASDPVLLLNDPARAQHDPQCWQARLPRSGSGRSAAASKVDHLEIVISLPENSQHVATALRVYNYNGSADKLPQGAKWMAVFRSNRMIWHGVLRQGTGDADADCSVTVQFSGRPNSHGVHSQTPRSISDSPWCPEASCAPRPSAAIPYSTPIMAPDVTALSDAMLLAELARRGIGVVPTPKASTQGEATEVQKTVQPFLSDDALSAAAAVSLDCLDRNTPDVPCAVAAQRVVPPASNTNPEVTADVRPSPHSYPQPEIVACGPEWTIRPPVRRSSDSANMAQELVLSADANLKMPPMPVISVPDANSILSPNFELSPTSHRPSRSLSLDSPEDTDDIRLVDADICLADAVRQKAESVTGCLVTERANTGAIDTAADVGGGHLGGRVVSGRHKGPGDADIARPTRLGAVLAELPQQARSSMQGDGSAAPLSLQPEPMMSMPPGVDSARGHPKPQSTQSSLTGALGAIDGATVDVLDNDVLGDFAGRVRPPIPPTARRRSAKGPPLPPSRAANPDAENAYGKAHQPTAGRRGPPADLNQSLDSLTFFQRHNRSRLTEPALPGLLEQGSDECDEKGSALESSDSPVVPVLAGLRSGGAASAKHSQREAMKHLPSAPEAAVKASVTGSSAWSVQHEGLSFLMEMGESAEALSLSMDVSDAVPAAGVAKGEPAQWPDPEFRVPVEPTGRHLVLRLFSTWGDMHYIGLSAIEVFDHRGTLVSLSDRISQVTADPHSVNVLSEYSGDPRLPSNLFDGVNCTSSDLHQWLAPYSPGKVHSVWIDLGREVSLGMLRVWNYNKSRIHSQRGVRSMEAWLGDCCIFQGEISQAPGAVHGAPQCAECIVFTCNAAALDEIERHDRVYEQPAESYEADLTPFALQAGAPEIELVPGTSPRCSLQLMTRPHTAAVVPKAPPTSPRGVMCRTVVIEVLSTWGDADFVGLTAVRLLDGGGQPIELSAAAVRTDPRDLNTIAGHSGDDRTPDKLVDPVCVTTDDRHMWLAPCAHGSGRVCTITVQVAPEPRLVSGVMLWNYNKDSDGTLRGVGSVRITADDELVTPACGVAVPKAPAADALDFGHTIPLPCLWSGMPAALMSGPPLQSGLIAAMRDPDAAFSVLSCQVFMEAGKHVHHTTTIQQDCLTPLLPSGFVLKLVIWSTWGDPFYVGLTGLEVYDASVGLVNISPARVNATPFSSVAVLPNMAGDARTPDKLVSGDMSGTPSRSWLAPRPKCAPHEARPNTVIFMLPHAVALSKIKLWNYSKSPERGVCEMDVLLDDCLIFSGYLKKASSDLCHQAIMFTNSPSEIAAEVDSVTSCASDVSPTRVTLIDEKKVRRRGETLLGNLATPSDRPSTAVVF